MYWNNILYFSITSLRPPEISFSDIHCICVRFSECVFVCMFDYVSLCMRVCNECKAVLSNGKMLTAKKILCREEEMYNVSSRKKNRKKSLIGKSWFVYYCCCINWFGVRRVEITSILAMIHSTILTAYIYKLVITSNSKYILLFILKII